MAATFRLRGVEHQNFAIPGRASMPRGTEDRIHKRVLALRAEAALLAPPREAFWGSLGA